MAPPVASMRRGTLRRFLACGVAHPVATPRTCVEFVELTMRIGLRALALGAVLIACLSITDKVRANDYPTRPITLIAPWAAGGAIDALCRAIGPKLAERLGQHVIVENRPGAASTLGVAAGARAAPDGY